MTHTEAGVLAAAARLVDAFSRHDSEAYFAAFAEDASFIFHNLDRVLTSRDAYRAEWRLWEERDGFRVLGCRSSDQAVQLAGDVAVFTHTVETDVSAAGEILTNLERETIVFRREGGEWVAFHEHLSPCAR
jgi:ketosteroid isomerase-like protein